MDSNQSHRIVVKVGTNALTDQYGELDLTVMEQLVSQIVQLREKGFEVILVSSGAVGAGKSILSLSNTKDEVISRQVYSSVGQVKLMGIYAELFGKQGVICAQVLATKEDFTGLEHYKNMKNCFSGLLNDHVLPIVNENDVVSLTELMFTDNDELAGLTAFMIGAEKLFLLTNVDGIYNGSPGEKGAKVISQIAYEDNQYEKYLSERKSSDGRGGMQSKYDIAKKAAEKGITTYIGNGKNSSILQQMLEQHFSGTVFIPKNNN